MGPNQKRLEKAESLVETNPTPEQIKNGTYRKSVLSLFGNRIVIENPKGSFRSGTDSEGNTWRNRMTYTYGYFENTKGADGDELDVFIGPQIDNDFDVYVIDQIDPYTKEFDEHKIMFGFSDIKDAYSAYMANYQSGWLGFSYIKSLSLSDFKSWKGDKNKTTKPINDMTKDKVIETKMEVEEPQLIVIQLKGDVERGSLDLLMFQVKELTEGKGLKKGDILTLEIASPGGSVEGGLNIMLWLEHLSKKGVEIVTCVTANAYSIASLIMLAADTKLISEHAEIMVHNPMIPELNYANANELEIHVESLRELENFMYSLYQAFTGMDVETIKNLMDAETFLTPEEAVQYGFADLIVSIKKTPYEMANINLKKKVNMASTINTLKHVIAKLNGSNVVDQLYYDTKGGAVEIYQSDPSQYQVGDKVSVGIGEVQLSDGKILKIEEGQIKEIVPATIEEPAIVEEPEIEEVPVIEEGDINVAPANPNVPLQEEKKEDGTVAEDEEPITEGENASTEKLIEPEAKAEEVVAEKVEGSEATLVTGDPNVGPAPKEEMVEEPIAKADEEVVAEKVEEAEMKAEEEVVAEVVTKEQFEALQQSVNSLAASIQAQIEKSEMFESTAGKAIEALAKNTSSSFKPRQAVVANAPRHEVIGKNSIFARAKREAQNAKR